MNVRSIFIVLGNEIRKGLLHAWSERLQILIELPMFAVFLLLLGPTLGQGQQLAAGRLDWRLNSGATSVLVVWFIPYIFFYMQVVKMFWRLLGEIQSGTIEQVYLSPLPSWAVAAAGRVIAALAETSVVAAATYLLVDAFVPVRIHWSPAAVVPTIAIVFAATGTSLIIAGATLVFKRIQMIMDTMLMLVFLFSAAAVPLITVPSWWSTVSRAFPLTSGVASLYSISFAGQSGLSTWGIGGFVELLATAVGYMAAGILTFRIGEKTAKRRGTLARY